MFVYIKKFPFDQLVCLSEKYSGNPKPLPAIIFRNFGQSEVMSAIADSQPHLEISSSQPLFSQQDDSQSTQSSTGLSQCKQFFEYILTEKATPEEFKRLTNSQSHGTPNSLFSSQRSSQKGSANSTDRALRTFMGYPEEDGGSEKLNKVSPKSIPESQLTNYFSNENTKTATKEASLFDTPITSQEDNGCRKTPIESPNTPPLKVQTVVERMEGLTDGNGAAVENDQPMESDEPDNVSTSDNEQENQVVGNLCTNNGIVPNAHNADAFGLAGKQDLAFGRKLVYADPKKQPNYSSFDQAKTVCKKANQPNPFNGKQQVEGYISIGKSNEIITKLEAYHHSQIDLPNCDSPAAFPVQSIGKLESNFGKHFDPCQDYQQPMEIQCIDEPAYGQPAFGAHENQNHADQFPPSQYPGK